MRDFKFGRQALLGLMLVMPLGGCGDGEELDEHERDRIDKGLALSPVPVNLDGKDRTLVGLGSYIVNAQGACNDCHTNPPYAPGGDPFQGQPEQIDPAHFLGGGRAFGPIITPNITPDEQGRPAGLTREEFVTLMRTGMDEGRLLQVMPWPIYSKMTDRDLYAIYEYLSAIPHAEPGP
jgi:hypothetical protein